MCVPEGGNKGMAKKKLEEINIHTDGVLWHMFHLAKDAVGSLCTWMQDNTEYGPEYEAAFKQHNKLRKELDKYNDLLAQCAKHKKGGKKEDEGNL